MTTEGPVFAGKYPPQPRDNAVDAEPSRPVVGGLFAPSQNTPGVGGYLLAVLVSWVLISGGLGLVTSVSDFEPQQLRAAVDWEWMIFGTVFWAMVSGFFALGVAPVGVIVLHLACRNVAHQGVHVLATALLGALAVYAVALILDGSPGGWHSMAAGVGLCTAAGRAAVIPLVPAVRRRLLVEETAT